MATLTVSKEEEKRLKGMGFLSNKGTDNFSARVITVNGKVTAAQQRCLAEAAEKFGNGILTFTTRQTVEVQGIPYENIDAFQEYLAKEGLETGGTGPLIRPIVSCKGTTCQYGLLDSFALSEEIHKRFYKGYRAYKLPHKFKIAVGGCPNNCVKPNLNDLGIIGQRIPTYDASLCKGCKKCSVAEACPNGAPKLVDGVMQIDKDICKNSLCRTLPLRLHHRWRIWIQDLHRRTLGQTDLPWESTPQSIHFQGGSSRCHRESYSSVP